MSLLVEVLEVRVLLAILLAVLVGYFTMPIIIKLAVKKDLVAKPNHRTSHKGSIPNIGGVVVFLSFILSFLSFVYLENIPDLQYFLLGFIWLFFIGLTDDVLIIAAKRKLIGEVIGIFVVICLGKFYISDFHGFLGIGEIPYIISILFTTFVVIVIINALNLIDGIDGLASGIGMIVSLFYGSFFLLVGGEKAGELAVMSFSTFGALIIFFIYNVFGTRGKVFMGDAGALCLGFILAILTISFLEIDLPNNPIPSTTMPLLAMSVLVLPLFDTLRVFLIRALKGKSPFKPDKTHLHHCLLALGFSHRKATATLLGANVLFIVVCLLGKDLNPLLLMGILLAMAVGMSWWLVRRVEKGIK